MTHYYLCGSICGSSFERPATHIGHFIPLDRLSSLGIGGMVSLDEHDDWRVRVDDHAAWRVFEGNRLLVERDSELFGHQNSANFIFFKQTWIKSISLCLKLLLFTNFFLWLYKKLQTNKKKYTLQVYNKISHYLF